MSVGSSFKVYWLFIDGLVWAPSTQGVTKPFHLAFLLSQDTILDAIRKTKVNFVRCILPVDTAGQMDSRDTELGNKTGEDLSSLNVPLVRTQLRSAEMLDAVRIHRQGG